MEFQYFSSVWSADNLLKSVFLRGEWNPQAKWMTQSGSLYFALFAFSKVTDSLSWLQMHLSNMLDIKSYIIRKHERHPVIHYFLS